ncbi:PH domain-containing protein [Aequorivita capsosiphonis]|uniref:PH domain-containing protein n=1 Tax=Aequorivita capsosiphonis TaxID=487317 RepID=UPI00040740E1|nr:PH domain-containing protein [Aequorivita capsosiphonis]
MTIYKSRSSNSVRIITIGGILLLISIIISIILIREHYEITIGIGATLILLGFLIYFYFNSLQVVIIKNEILILKKNIGKIEIKFSEIKSVKSISGTVLTMTAGSKGFFGFIGVTMDGSKSFVKDRSNVIQLITSSNKKYLFSCDNSEDLINKLDFKKPYR